MARTVLIVDDHPSFRTSARRVGSLLATNDSYLFFVGELFAALPYGFLVQICCCRFRPAGCIPAWSS